jgi:hypothetical protein
LDANFVCPTPKDDEDAGAGDDVNTDHDHEAACRIDAKEPARSVPSLLTQEQWKRSAEHDDSARGSSHHGLEDKTSIPPNISRRPSTKKDEEILYWMDGQPETLHLSGHDAERAPEFPPSRSDSSDINAPGDTFDVAKEREPQPVEFTQLLPTQLLPSSPKPLHPPRLHHARTASQDPNTRGKSVLWAWVIDLRTDPGVLIRNSASRIAKGSVRRGIASGKI